MEGKHRPAGKSSDNNDASRPNTSSTLAATKTSLPQNHVDDSQQIPNPELPPRAWTGDPNLRDAIELDTVIPETSRPSSPESISSGSFRVVTPQATRVSTRSSVREPTGLFAPVIKFWKRHVVLSVAQKQCRDHFALERTFLAYFRTSLTFAILGVFIAQLFSIQRRVHHDPEFGFYKVGLPLSCACYGVAIIVSLLGAHRFWRQQQAMANSKVYAGGWDLNAVGILTVATVLVLFVLVIVIAAHKV
ncbi:hypothetical protein VTO42DRAFT_2700 [Malbranchea cinnamomea]